MSKTNLDEAVKHLKETRELFLEVMSTCRTSTDVSVASRQILCRIIQLLTESLNMCEVLRREKDSPITT